MSELDRPEIVVVASPTRLASRVAATAICAFAAGLACAQPASSYASLADWPAFAGAWTPLTPPFVLPPVVAASARLSVAQSVDAACSPLAAARFKSEVVALCRELTQEGLTAGADLDNCRRESFNGTPPRGAGGALEILYTPGRVTMAVEAGLVRRIYLRAEPPPDALDVSRSGTSIGRWEGSALVVTTTGLDPAAPIAVGAALGERASIAERFSLLDADTLQIESTLTAPSVLSAPLTMRQSYRRAPSRFFTDFDTCVASDRSYDRTTGLDRFDKTPPADLPPPPSE